MKDWYQLQANRSIQLYIKNDFVMGSDGFPRSEPTVLGSLITRNGRIAEACIWHPEPVRLELEENCPVWKAKKTIEEQAYVRT